MFWVYDCTWSIFNQYNVNIWILKREKRNWRQETFEWKTRVIKTQNWSGRYDRRCRIYCVTFVLMASILGAGQSTENHCRHSDHWVFTAISISSGEAGSGWLSSWLLGQLGFSCRLPWELQEECWQLNLGPWRSRWTGNLEHIAKWSNV